MNAPVGDPVLINDVIAAVDVKRLASDQPSGVVSEERGGNAHVVDADEAPCRRFRLRLVQQGCGAKLRRQARWLTGRF